MLPIGLKSEPVDGRERGAEPDRAGAAVFDVHRHWQRAVRRDLVRLLDPDRPEHAEPGQAFACGGDGVGIELGAFGDVGHVFDEGGIGPARALHPRRAEAGLSAGIESDRHVERVGRMVGDHVAPGLDGLGMSELPPLFDGDRAGRADDAGACGLPGGEAHAVRGIDLILLVRGEDRRIHEPGLPERELRSGAHDDRDRGCRRKLDGKRQVRHLLAVDLDADLAAVVPLAVERRENAAVIAAGTGQEPGLAGGGFFAAAPKRGGVFDDALKPVVRAFDPDRDAVRQRVDDLDAAVIRLFRAPEADSEQFECEHGRRRGAERRRQNTGPEACAAKSPHQNVLPAYDLLNQINLFDESGKRTLRGGGCPILYRKAFGGIRGRPVLSPARDPIEVWSVTMGPNDRAIAAAGTGAP